MDGCIKEHVMQLIKLNCSFNLRMEFRTFYEDGLLFYITNEDQTDFVAVQLKGGQIQIVYKGNTMVSGELLGDGRWHQVKRITR